MYLNDVKLWGNVWQQIIWKLKAYSATFGIVLFVQILFSILTLQGVNTTTVGGSYIQLRIETYGIEAILSVSAVAIFAMTIVLTNRASSNENLSIVASKLTAILSTIGYTLILSVVATCTAVSSFYITIAAAQLFGDGVWVAGSTMLSLKSMTVCFSLHVIAAALGLLLGTIFSKSKVLLAVFVFLMMIIIPNLLFGLVLYETVEYEPAVAPTSANYYIVSLYLLIGAAVCYILAAWLRTRQEVVR